MKENHILVEQADRDAAASLIMPAWGDIPSATLAYEISGGRQDNHPLVQAFARHRLASLNTQTEEAPPKAPDQNAVPLAFIEAILHGDEAHRIWLLEAAACWNSGAPVPPPTTPEPTDPVGRNADYNLGFDDGLAIGQHNAAQARMTENVEGNELADALDVFERVTRLADTLSGDVPITASARQHIDRAYSRLAALRTPVSGDNGDQVERLREAFERHIETFDPTGPGREVDALMDAVKPVIETLSLRQPNQGEARRERERCAKVADEIAESNFPLTNAIDIARHGEAKFIADSIRALGDVSDVLGGGGE